MVATPVLTLTTRHVAVVSVPSRGFDGCNASSGGSRELLLGPGFSPLAGIRWLQHVSDEALSDLYRFVFRSPRGDSMVATLLTSPTRCAKATAANPRRTHQAAVCPIAGAARKTLATLRRTAVTGQRGGMRRKWPGRPGCSPASHQTSDAWPSRGDQRLCGAPVRSAAFRGRAEWEAGSETSARRAPVIPGPQEGAVAGAAARCCKRPRPPAQAAGVRPAAGPHASVAARAKGRSGSPGPARGSWRGVQPRFGPGGGSRASRRVSLRGAPGGQGLPEGPFATTEQVLSAACAFAARRRRGSPEAFPRRRDTEGLLGEGASPSPPSSVAWYPVGRVRSALSPPNRRTLLRRPIRRQTSHPTPSTPAT
jgi:hypothetical protein